LPKVKSAAPPVVKIDILDMLTDPTNQRAWLQHHSTVARHVEYQLVED